MSFTNSKHHSKVPNMCGLVPYAYNRSRYENQPMDEEGLLHDPRVCRVQVIIQVKGCSHDTRRQTTRPFVPVAQHCQLLRHPLPHPCTPLFIYFLPRLHMLVTYRNEAWNEAIDGNIRINGIGVFPPPFLPLVLTCFSPHRRPGLCPLPNAPSTLSHLKKPGRVQGSTYWSTSLCFLTSLSRMGKLFGLVSIFHQFGALFVFFIFVLAFMFVPSFILVFFFIYFNFWFSIFCFRSRFHHLPLRWCRCAPLRPFHTHTYPSCSSHLIFSRSLCHRHECYRAFQAPVHMGLQLCSVVAIFV